MPNTLGDLVDRETVRGLHEFGLIMDTFTVDLTRRKVTHSSGARATFDRHPTAEDWHASEVVKLSNIGLYDGPAAEFGRRAKEAALAAGMDHGGD